MSNYLQNKFYNGKGKGKRKGKGQNSDSSEQSLNEVVLQFAAKNLENQRLQKVRQAKLNCFDTLLLKYLEVTNQEIIRKRENRDEQTSQKTERVNKLEREQPRVRKQKRETLPSPEPVRKTRKYRSVSPTRSEMLECSLDDLVQINKTQDRKRKHDKHERENFQDERRQPPKLSSTNLDRESRYRQSENFRQTRERSRTPPRIRGARSYSESPVRMSYTVQRDSEDSQF